MLIEIFQSKRARLAIAAKVTSKVVNKRMALSDIILFIVNEFVRVIHSGFIEMLQLTNEEIYFKIKAVS